MVENYNIYHINNLLAFFINKLCNGVKYLMSEHFKIHREMLVINIYKLLRKVV